ncbi:transposase [Variovorax sp. LG9.2]|uniref:transposase n=1 Tax=Variovorax sp. LG9.2 TaxID=3048626 RepID=UPI002B2373FE|nr:transposase [Variovorax sp. LG9.2]MEB0056188.1 transposase [Variovorax sp. LG9.2]
MHDLKDEDLQGLAPEAIAALAQQMLQRLRQQDNEIRFKDAKIEKITFQLARLKAWKFGAKTEAMNAEQRRLFEETLAEDEASLQAQLEQARGERATTNTSHVVDHCPITCAAWSTTTNRRTRTARTRSAASR